MSARDSLDEGQQALLDAVVGVVRESRAMEQGREAAEETRRALLSMVQTRAPERADEAEHYLMTQAGPDSARVGEFVEGMVANMAQLLIDSFTLEELQTFGDVQRTARFQQMAPEFATALQRPLRDFQEALIRDVNERFR